ncbi:MAG: DUF362 domain-containing protein [Dehalococcoidia bacterium]|nr:DUF362 domain-containing protein [Dehalococcoidia bacterium]MDZ4246220.1 DUF362 domain-containing protein [Dehalococcoidia bacterium]
MAKLKDNRISRRSFIKGIAATGALAVAGMAGCNEAGEAPTIVAGNSGEGKMSEIAFVSTDNRADGVEKAMDLVGTGKFKNKTIFIKPNFNSADPTPGSTHIDVLRSIVKRLWQEGASGITVGDRSGMGNTRKAMEQKGIFQLGRELDFEVLVLDELPESGWQKFTPSGSRWSQGFYIPKVCLEVDDIIQTCCLKTHRFGGHFTMSLKNSVGLAAKRVPGDGHDYMGELHSSPYQRTMIAEINQAYKPSLVILDGVEAFVSGGPDKGKKVDSNIVLAGSDRVAIDAVGVAVLRYFGTTPEVEYGSIFEQEQISRAVQLELGVDSGRRISLVTPDRQSEEYAGRIHGILYG